MKNEILKLRSEGKSYKQIKKILGCSLSTISFHCGDGQKEKNYLRNKKYKSKNYLSKKLTFFKGKKKITSAVRDFQRREGGKLINKIEKYDFNYLDVIEKFGVDTKCYLSGEPINLINDKNYSLDHIVPIVSGGENSLDNLGILDKRVNCMKHTLSIDEFIGLCEKILKYNGYNVEKQ